ncbi:imidazole glycerol phosphate synthase subunit HisH, partial [Pyxidicoccus sp. 3LFB2]
MRVTLFDYGAGNLHSLAKALATVEGAEVRVQEDPVRALDTDVLVLPGVGAFG